MRILYIANIRLPTEKAHGKQIMETCNALAKLGQEITLLIPKRINTLKDNPFSFYGLSPYFAIKKVFCIDFLFMPFLKHLSFLLESASFIISVFFYGSINAKKYEIIYTRDLGTASCVSWLRPTVYEIHNLPDHPGFFHRMTWRRSKLLVVISNGLLEDLIGFGADSRKIVLARDAVDLQKFDIDISQEEARRMLKIGLQEKIVLYTGHLFPWKGADLLAEAANLMPSVQVYFVGGAKNDLEKFSKKYRSANIHIVGYRPADEIPLWLKAADILVLPNRGEEKISAKYTSPLKLFEYMVSGTPMVASDLPSIREILSEEETVFFRESDIVSLTAVLDHAVNNLTNLKLKSEKAKQKAEEFTWSKRAQIILNSIKQ